MNFLQAARKQRMVQKAVKRRRVAALWTRKGRLQ